jgi:hypothetical protein
MDRHLSQGHCQRTCVFVAQPTTFSNMKVTVELCIYLTSERPARHIVAEESFELNALSHSMSNANPDTVPTPEPTVQCINACNPACFLSVPIWYCPF